MKSTKQNGIDIERGITVQFNNTAKQRGCLHRQRVWSSSGHVVTYGVSWSITAIIYDAKFVWFR